MIKVELAEPSIVIPSTGNCKRRARPRGGALMGSVGMDNDAVNGAIGADPVRAGYCRIGKAAERSAIENDYGEDDALGQWVDLLSPM